MLANCFRKWYAALIGASIVVLTDHDGEISFRVAHRFDTWLYVRRFGLFGCICALYEDGTTSLCYVKRWRYVVKR